jgi:ADP-ribose pyrophosphatase
MTDERRAADPRDLTEHRIDSTRVYDGALLHVRRDRVRLPDGGEGVREYIVHPGAVCIVPMFDDGSLLLVRQYRYPPRREFIELPAGKLDPGEAPLATGKRELLEETGYVAAHWDYVMTMHPVVGYSDERIELWLARGLTHRGARPDQGEFLEPVTMTLDAALEAVRDGQITDAKTIVGIFRAERIMNGSWAPSPPQQEARDTRGDR